MRIEFINPFITSTLEILQETLNVEVIEHKIMLRNDTAIKEVAAIIGIAGNVEGRVLFDMEEQTAISIASSMVEQMGMQPVVTFDDMAYSAINEILNMITGRAVSILSKDGFSFDITPPSIIRGTNMKLSSAEKEVLIIPMELPYGLIEINISMKEKQKTVKRV